MHACVIIPFICWSSLTVHLTLKFSDHYVEHVALFQAVPYKHLYIMQISTETQKHVEMAGGVYRGRKEGVDYQ